MYRFLKFYITVTSYVFCLNYLKKYLLGILVENLSDASVTKRKIEMTYTLITQQ